MRPPAARAPRGKQSGEQRGPNLGQAMALLLEPAFTYLPVQVGGLLGHDARLR